MITPNLPFGTLLNANYSANSTPVFQCHPNETTEAGLIFSLGALGMAANLILMALILTRRPLRRWSQGLLFHQALVDFARAAILMPLGVSILKCQPVNKCSLVETAFLLLVTVSTVNMLTTVLNDAPVLPDEVGEEAVPLLMDSPQCVAFGTFMIWFASITINLGPTFLSGALAANVETTHNAPSCPLVHGPFRHYVLNVLWIIINVLCVALTLFQLHKLYRDLTKANVEAVRIAGLVTTMISVSAADDEVREHRRIRNYIRRMEREGLQRVKMFVVITLAYVIFWGPLFLVTLLQPGSSLKGGSSVLGYELTLHVAYIHAFINPTLFLVLHRGLRQGVLDMFCCSSCSVMAIPEGIPPQSIPEAPGRHLHHHHLGTPPLPPPDAHPPPPPPPFPSGNHDLMTAGGAGALPINGGLMTGSPAASSDSSRSGVYSTE